MPQAGINDLGYDENQPDRGEGLADASCSEVTTHYELEGLVEKWRMIASHRTLEAAQADLADYEEWSKDAVAAWKGFRLIEVTNSRKMIAHLPNAKGQP